jgi:carbohydrate-selective porin OprB
MTLANAEDSTAQVNSGDDATIWNWAVTLAVSNLDKKGSQAGLVVGQPPKVTQNDGGEEDGETAWHVEGFYRYQVTEGIAIEPGIVTVFNPEHEGNNDAVVVGNIRTIFLF